MNKRATWGSKVRPKITTLASLLVLLVLSVCTALGAPEATGPETEAFSWRLFLAPFHSVLLHFPIGFLVIAFFLDLYYLRSPKPEVRKIVFAILALCAASSVVVASLGLLRAGGGGYESEALRSHRFYGILIAALIVIAVPFQRRAYRPESSGLSRVAFRFFMTGCMIVIVITGHKGGNLTHGSSYLVKNAPYWVKAWIAHAPEEPAADSSAHSTDEQFFVERIQPVFESKCVQCHGSEKQKGDYRLDVKEVALKGGESELTAIIPGNPMESFLVELILLPRDDDDAMPPEGKSALTPEEIVDIIHWIQDGAVFVEAEGSSEAVTADAN